MDGVQVVIPADINARVREIIERPIAELVALGLEGGELGAVRMLARQFIIRLCLADDLEGLQDLRDEIDDHLEPVDDVPPARPFLQVVS